MSHDQGKTNTVKVCLTLNVEYDLGGESVETMQEYLENSVHRLICNGGLSGETSAEVVGYDFNSAVIQPEVDPEDDCGQEHFRRPGVRP